MPESPTATRRRVPRPALGETQLCACTINQIEERNPGVKGRMRSWIHRADRGDPEFAGLRHAIIRVGRSVLVDELRFIEFLRQRAYSGEVDR
jgi:hypothetical protein